MPETKTIVVNLRLGEEFDVYIGRGHGSIWGNPYSHLAGTLARHKVITRAQAISSYRDYLLSSPRLLAQLPSIQGKRLGCFCVPFGACHGEVLAEVADALADGKTIDEIAARRAVRLTEAVYK